MKKGIKSVFKRLLFSISHKVAWLQWFMNVGAESVPDKSHNGTMLKALILLAKLYEYHYLTPITDTYALQPGGVLVSYKPPYKGGFI